MLGSSEVHANIPASDLQRARRFYTEQLGLSPSFEDDFHIVFPTPSGSWFQIYQTASAGTGKHTLMQWDVPDLTSAVRELEGRGVPFQHYDLPGVEWDGHIASMGGQRAAWFTDSEDNVMCLDERPSS
jgi:catechol 2,3-dioxygenase-like lactoylglutathione lyase family enzyme